VNVLDLRSQTIPYGTAWNWQLDLLQHHLALQDAQPNNCGNPCVGTVIICQHKSVYTLGTATTLGSGPFSTVVSDGTTLEYETYTVERAGQATYHGPGQLVMYPILDLHFFEKDIHCTYSLLVDWVRFSSHPNFLTLLVFPPSRPPDFHPFAFQYTSASLSK
jgi:lipoyl(octanoyl) transferase